jgi:hypothetical protein
MERIKISICFGNPLEIREHYLPGVSTNRETQCGPSPEIECKSEDEGFGVILFLPGEAGFSLRLSLCLRASVVKAFDFSFFSPNRSAFSPPIVFWLYRQQSRKEIRNANPHQQTQHDPNSQIMAVHRNLRPRCLHICFTSPYRNGCHAQLVCASKHSSAFISEISG